MASAWIERRILKDGSTSYLVRFRLGGRETKRRHGGSFRTMREARSRREWVAGELAQMRIPDLTLFDPPVVSPTLREIAAAWRRSRVDVRGGTAAAHAVNLSRILQLLGDLRVDEITVVKVAELVAALTEKKLARQSIRKTRSTLAMVLDFAGVEPNPARDRSVRLPVEDPEELTPPTAAHVLAVLRLLRPALRLPLLVLDATGMRVGELEQLLWGDVDEPAGRWRVRRAVAKTWKPRWVPVTPVELFDAVVKLVPREDRILTGQVFDGFGADRFRTAIAKACKAAAVPLFSPHDLRHRRATLWHMQGVPVVEAASWLGHSPTEHVKTYAHATLADRRELVYSDLLQACGAPTGGHARIA